MPVIASKCSQMWKYSIALLQAEALKLNKPLMVVGTPGRLTELSRMGRLQVHKCHTLVLDEVKPCGHVMASRHTGTCYCCVAAHLYMHSKCLFVNGTCWELPVSEVTCCTNVAHVLQCMSACSFVICCCCMSTFVELRSAYAATRLTSARTVLKPYLNPKGQCRAQVIAGT